MIPNIAIQGHLTRGEEVIQILKSLCGINKWKQNGMSDDCAYYIDGIGNIYCFEIHGYHGDKKIYTLEEFEKEFPFKIGDKVKDCSDNEIGIILGFIDIDGKLMYVVNFEKSGDANMPAEELKPYKIIKEERNITLTLDKAKEWYNKGGELKEVALQAYSEEELTKAELPRTWKEFCVNYPIQVGEAFINGQTSLINKYNNIFPRRLVKDKNVCPSEKSAEAHLALIQLEQLRDCYRQGDIPDFTKETNKYCIVKINKRIDIVESFYTSFFLSFTKKEVAEEFLTNFKPLIKIAEDYI